MVDFPRVRLVNYSFDNHDVVLWKNGVGSLELTISRKGTTVTTWRINPMQFEGVTAEDSNYHIVMYSMRGDHEARMLLIYPNGIIAIYDHLLARNRKPLMKDIFWTDC
jgi:hypothetical protein